MTRLPVLALALCVPTLAPAATLRPMTTLASPVVRLSDLFDDAGPLAGRVLGPAPAPGERIVVEARQLSAIARMFGVAWHPVSPADTAVLERPGRPLPRAALNEALAAALAGVGAPADLDIVLPGYAAPMLPRETAAALTVEQLDYDDATGGFTASVLVTGEGMAPLRLRLAGRAEEMVRLMVPARALPAGSVLRASDLMPVRLRASDLMPVRLRRSSLHGEVARDAAQLVGMTLRAQLAAGRPVRLADLAPPGAVAKGAPVVLQVESGALSATAQGIALASGSPGERIPVLNPLSRRVVEGEVLPSGVVAVTPGSLPVAGGAP